MWFQLIIFQIGACNFLKYIILYTLRTFFISANARSIIDRRIPTHLPIKSQSGFLVT